MPGSLYLKTLADLRGTTLAWSLAMVLVGAANVLLYPTIQGYTDLIAFLDNMPPAFKAMIGDVRSMAQLEGFLRVKVFDALPLLLSIFAVGQGANLIAGEIEMKSLDLLLARPVPRWRVAAAKYLALITCTMAMTLTLVVTLIVCARVIGSDLGVGYLLAASLNGLPLTWFFGAIALLGSCLLPRARQAALTAGGLVIVGYVFETLRLLSDKIRGWDEISVFAQQKAGMSLTGEIHAVPILMLLGLAALVAGGAAVALERRDLAD